MFSFLADDSFFLVVSLSGARSVAGNSDFLRTPLSAQRNAARCCSESVLLVWHSRRIDAPGCWLGSYLGASGVFAWRQLGIVVEEVAVINFMF